MANPKIDEGTVEVVVEHHFEKKPKKVTQLTGGLANIVYETEVNGEEYIVRMNDEAWKLQFFLKEQWAVNEARERGVPTPEVLEVGNEIVPTPYTILRKARGVSALEHPKRMDILAEMGKYAAIINSIPTTGYGHVFDWSNNTLSKNETWKDFLEKERNVPEALRVFEKHKMLTEANMRAFRKHLKQVMSWKRKPTLAHYDMRLKNVLVDEKTGKITSIIDWDDCKSLIAPEWDLSIAIHDLNIDEKQVFLAGYGISEKRFRKIAPGIKTINILNYWDHIVVMAENKEKEKLEQYRTRMNGYLDLYSL